MDPTAQRKLAIAGQELRPLGRIGEGTYACVLLASICKSRSNAPTDISSPSATAPHPHKTANSLCAIKIFKSKSDEVVRLARREVVAHTRLNGHPNIVHLRGAYRSGGGRPILIMEYCPKDLQSELRHHPSGLPGASVKLLAWQLIQAFRYMHAEKFIHRDLKPTNLLLSADGILKVSDFGLAREAPMKDPRIGAPGEPLTQYVVTRWYRAPEILLNKPYGTASDIWSIGCTIAEMAIGAPLLPGKSAVDQIFQIYRMFGSLPQQSPQPARRTAPAQKSSFRSRLGALLGRSLLDVLEAALRTNPLERATAEELLRMPYFDDISELVVGTALETLYDWSSNDGAATVRAANTVARSIHLQSKELDLPLTVKRVNAAAAMATADDDVATSPATSLCTIPVPSGEGKSRPKESSGGGGGAGVTAVAAGTEPYVKLSSIDRGYANDTTVIGKHDVVGMAAIGIGGVRSGSTHRCSSGGGSGGQGGSNDPRVTELSADVAKTCPRAGSVPILDGQGLVDNRTALRRMNSVVTFDKMRPCDTGSAADDGANGLRGGRGDEGGARAMPRVRMGSRGSTSSLRRFFVQGRPPSALSTWGKPQWDLTTSSGFDADTLQMELSGPALVGRLRMTSTTAVAIPEDSPLRDDSESSSTSPSQSRLIISDVQAMALPSAITSHMSSRTSHLTEIFPSSSTSRHYQQQQQHPRQHQQQCQQPPASAAVMVSTTSVSGGYGPMSIVRPLPDLASFVTPNVVPSSTRPTPPPAEVSSVVGLSVDVTASGGELYTYGGAHDSCSHVILPQVNMGPPMMGEPEAQFSTGGQSARTFVLKIMSIIGGDGMGAPMKTATAAASASTKIANAVQRWPPAPAVAGGSGGGIGSGDMAAAAMIPGAAAAVTAEANSELLCRDATAAKVAGGGGGGGGGGGSGEATIGGFAVVNPFGEPLAAVSDIGALEPQEDINTARLVGMGADVPSTASRNRDGRRGTPFEYDTVPPEAACDISHTTAQAALALDAWTWNCTTCGGVSGSCSYGRVAVVAAAEREMALLGACTCGCSCGKNTAEIQMIKARVGTSHLDRTRSGRVRGVDGPYFPVDSEDPRGSSFGCSAYKDSISCACKCKAAAAATVAEAEAKVRGEAATLASARRGGSASRRFLNFLRSLVICSNFPARTGRGKLAL